MSFMDLENGYSYKMIADRKGQLPSSLTICLKYDTLYL